MTKLTYCEAIREGYVYLLNKYPQVFVMGQGLWSPWYVGGSMRDLDKEFGTDRIIDTPISELATTGAAIGASQCGYRPIVVHPRLDFMLLATDQIINQAAKWSYMFSGKAKAPVTIRGIVNRGGEQGAQHSQALHSLYAHIPGLRVVMPATVKDARDLLIASVLCDDPVLYIDDRWLGDIEDEIGEPEEISLADVKPQCHQEGSDITLVGSSYSFELCKQAALDLRYQGIKAELFDVRMINPLDISPISESVRKTGHLCVVDGGWRSCGLAGEIISATIEDLDDISQLKSTPVRITLTDSPAPTSKSLEELYYTKPADIVARIHKTLKYKMAA